MAVTDQQQPTAGSRGFTRALVILAVVAVCAYILDRLAKYLVVENLAPGERVDIIGQLLQFQFVENPGAAFSLGSGSTWVFALIATAVVVFILVFARRIKSWGWAILFGLLLGGTLGNLTDRLTRPPGFGNGHVVDFIIIWGFPAIFNIADIAIVSAMGIFIILTLRGVHLDGTRTRKAAVETPAGDAPVVDGAPTDDKA